VCLCEFVVQHVISRVCVRERESERENERAGERERERQRESMHVPNAALDKPGSRWHQGDDKSGQDLCVTSNRVVIMCRTLAVTTTARDNSTRRTCGYGSLRFQISEVGLRVSGFGCWVCSFGFQVSGSRFRVSGFRYWVLGSGFRISRLGFGFLISSIGIRDSGFGKGTWAKPSRSQSASMNLASFFVFFITFEPRVE